MEGVQPRSFVVFLAMRYLKRKNRFAFIFYMKERWEFDTSRTKYFKGFVRSTTGKPILQLHTARPSTTVTASPSLTFNERRVLRLLGDHTYDEVWQQTG
jgi:hypothetical protein